MKFSIAQTLALISTVSAVTYSNTSYVPYGSGYFYDGQIYLDVILPNSGFTSFSIASGPPSAFSYSVDSVSGSYIPSGDNFPVTADVANGAIDVSADVDFAPTDTAAEVEMSGPIVSEQDEFVVVFVVNLEGLPQLIEKRADQEFTITVTATSSAPSSTTASTSSGATTTGPSTMTSGGTTYEENTTPSTVTATSTTLVTITSCSDDKCTETVVPTGVTIVTKDETVYTTWCPESSIDAGSHAITVTVTEDCTTVTPITTGTVVTTATITTKVTKTEYYTPKGKTETHKPTNPVNPTPVNPTPVNPTTTVPHPAGSSSALPTWEGAANNVQVGSGSLFALVTVFLSMLL